MSRPTLLFVQNVNHLDTPLAQRVEKWLVDLVEKEKSSPKGTVWWIDTSTPLARRVSLVLRRSTPIRVLERNCLDVRSPWQERRDWARELQEAGGGRIVMAYLGSGAETFFRRLYEYSKRRRDVTCETVNLSVAGSPWPEP